VLFKCKYGIDNFTTGNIYIAHSDEDLHVKSKYAYIPDDKKIMHRVMVDNEVWIGQDKLYQITNVELICVKSLPQHNLEEGRVYKGEVFESGNEEKINVLGYGILSLHNFVFLDNVFILGMWARTERSCYAQITKFDNNERTAELLSSKEQKEIRFTNELIFWVSEGDVSFEPLVRCVNKLNSKEVDIWNEKIIIGKIYHVSEEDKYHYWIEIESNYSVPYPKNMFSKDLAVHVKWKYSAMDFGIKPLEFPQVLFPLEQDRYDIRNLDEEKAFKRELAKRLDALSIKDKLYDVAKELNENM
jgi:desulfoferrodoxin (superoxide reductase-like protein)